MEAVLIQQNNLNNIFSTNIIPFNSVVLTNGTATFENSVINFLTTKSLKVNVGSYQTNDVSFNFGNILNTEAISEGKYFFSFAIQNNGTNKPNFTLIASVTINGATPIDLECLVDGTNTNFQTFGQVFEMQRGDTFSVNFKVIKDIASLFNTFSFYLDAFCLQPNVNGKFLPNGYVYPNNATGWQSKTDTINVISLPADVETTMTITTTVDGNGGLSLLDANAKITPIQLNDVLLIDMTCTFESVGIGDYVEILLKVGANVYRGYSYKITKGTGVDDLFSVSWSLPCGYSVMTNDVLIVLKPSITINYKNRYISVTKIHNGK